MVKFLDISWTEETRASLIKQKINDFLCELQNQSKQYKVWLVSLVSREFTYNIWEMLSTTIHKITKKKPEFEQQHFFYFFYSFKEP